MSNEKIDSIKIQTENNIPSSPKLSQKSHYRKAKSELTITKFFKEEGNFEFESLNEEIKIIVNRKRFSQMNFPLE
jgi:hypothetical protein